MSEHHDSQNAIAWGPTREELNARAAKDHQQQSTRQGQKQPGVLRRIFKGIFKK